MYIIIMENAACQILKFYYNMLPNIILCQIFCMENAAILWSALAIDGCHWLLMDVICYSTVCCFCAGVVVLRVRWRD